ncbi:MAG: hypothetical protein MK132_13930 [Lentisphaerales bacterium]|nr:hypothetical protein [Lentisphaerales bacterium]
MKKLKMAGYKVYFRQSLISNKFSLYNRINSFQDLIAAELKEESELSSKAVFGNFYLESSSHFYRNAFQLMSRYEFLQENPKKAAYLQAIATALSIQNNSLQSPLIVLRSLSRFYASQLKCGIAIKNKDLAIKATQSFLNHYISDSDFTGPAINFLDQNSHSEAADKLHSYTDQNFADIIEMFPKSATLYNNKAWNSSLCNRNLNQAELEVKKALELEADNAHYWDTLAEV